MTAAGGMRTEKLGGLQLGRAIAAGVVVMAHAIAHPYPGAPGVTHLMGRYGVTIFFVISGYIMVHTTGTGSFDPGRFLRRRLVRVVPLYYFATAFLAVLTLVVPNAFKNTVFDVGHIVASLLFIPQYRPDAEHLITPFFRLGWTLNYEMFFYVVFAGLFVLSAIGRTMMLTLAFVVLMLLGQWLQPDAAIPKFYTEMSLLGFVLGMWVALITLRSHAIDASATRRGLLIASLASLVALAWLYDDIRDNPWTQVWVAAVAAVHVLLLATSKMAVPRPLIVAGDASYSMYLFHMFAIGFVTVLEKFVPASFIYVMMLLATVLGIGSGIVVHYLVELPMNRWVRQRFEPRSGTRRLEALDEGGEHSSQHASGRPQP